MILVQAFVFLLIAALAGLTAWRALHGLRDLQSARGRDHDTHPNPGGIVAGLVLLALAFILPQSFGQVPAGYKGVVLRFGATTGEIKDPGLYWVTPVINSVVLMSTQVQAYNADAVEAASRDLQDVRTSVTVNYSLDPGSVARIYRDLRTDFLDRILRPAVQESVKASTAQFTAEELITKRPEVKDLIDKTLVARVEPYGIRIAAVSITNFKFSQTFENSIEQKVVATQQALTAQRNLERVRYEAQQQIELAKAQAQALQLQKQVVTPELVQLRRIEAQLKAIERWDGKMPHVVTGGGPVPLLDVFK